MSLWSVPATSGPSGRNCSSIAGSSVICKCCVLPSQIGSLCDALFRQARPSERCGHGGSARYRAGRSALGRRQSAAADDMRCELCASEVDRLRGNTDSVAVPRSDEGRTGRVGHGERCAAVDAPNQGEIRPRTDSESGPFRGGHMMEQLAHAGDRQQKHFR